MPTDHGAARAGRPRVVVVGAGIAGLAAAWELTGMPDPPQVTVLEAGPKVGGKLAQQSLDWDHGELVVDTGAESFLARRPQALALAAEVGLGEQIVHPQPGSPWIVSRGQRSDLPVGTLLGVPSSGSSVAGLLGEVATQVVQAESSRAWPRLDCDVSVAEFVAARVGQSVVDRLVEPLLGGVYAGQPALLSLQATMAGLWPAAQAGESIVAAAAAATAGTSGRGPVFAGLRGGVGRLPQHLAVALQARGVEIRQSTSVIGLARRPRGWRLTVAGDGRASEVEADAVVLATPVAAAARLLRAIASTAATELTAIESASVAVVTLAFDRAQVCGLTGSGVLVPALAGKLIKAATFSSNKWGWLADPAVTVLRASVGRHRQSQQLQLEDSELVRRVLADLGELPGLRLPPPLASLVTRWGGGLPQYAVGHLDRVARARRALGPHPGIGLAGAAYDGVGIAACIASGRQAARAALAAGHYMGSYAAPRATSGE